MRKIIITISILLLLVGCGNKNNTSDNNTLESKDKITFESIQPLAITFDEEVSKLIENKNIRMITYTAEETSTNMSMIQYAYIPNELNALLVEEGLEDQDELLDYVNEYVADNPGYEENIVVFLSTVQYLDGILPTDDTNLDLISIDMEDSKGNKIRAYTKEEFNIELEDDKDNMVAIDKFMKGFVKDYKSYVIEIEPKVEAATKTDSSKPSNSDFDFSNLVATDIDGNDVDASIFNGKYTVVNIWGTFCNPCIVEMPDLAKLHKNYSDKGYNVIGIISDTVEGSNQNIETAKKIIAQTGVEYVNIVPNEELLDELMKKVQFIPTTFIVDSYGKQVGALVIGSKDYAFFETLINTIK